MLSKIKRLSVLFTTVLAFSLVSPVGAQEAAIFKASLPLPQQDNAEQRINLSGKLRMLSQRIPSAACHLSLGIDVEGAAKLLNDAPAEFEAILNALEHGDRSLNILRAEDKRKALARINALREQWEPMKLAAASVANGTASKTDLDFVLDQNTAVLGAAVDLVAELVRLYSNPNAITHAELMLVDISGRQRMLTQKMSKESCILKTDLRTETTAQELAGTMNIFETSLEALIHGMPQVGLLPPPNSEISAGLSAVKENWTSVKPLLEQTLEGQDLVGAENEFKFQGLNTTMAKMNQVVGMYASAAKKEF